MTALQTDGSPSPQELLKRIEDLTVRVAELERKLAPVAVTTVQASSGEAVTSAAKPVTLPQDPVGQLKSLLEALFALAAMTDLDNADNFSERFEAFRALVHSSRQGSPLLDGDLRRYKFAPFVARFRDYLSAIDAPASFQIERMTPDTIDARTDVVKLYLAVRSGMRMSPPVAFRRDPKADGEFRIEQMSI